MHPQRNIVLVGFMGTGKSTVGRILADRRALSFVDMDAAIVEREGRSIPEIFALHGEAHFRAAERALVKELSSQSGLVVATGGGIVLNPDNITDFSRTGLVVCLWADPEDILRRVGRDTNRPLLACDDKLGRIRELLARRQPMYDRIATRIDTTGVMPNVVAERILAIYESDPKQKPEGRKAT